MKISWLVFTGFEFLLENIFFEFNLAILDIRNKLQYQECHWYAQKPSDDLLSPIEVSDVSVPFSDDVFQNLTVNVNIL